MPLSTPSLAQRAGITYGPGELLERYFEIAEKSAAERSLTLALHTDFAALVALNKRHREVWPPIPPIFDPGESKLGETTGFWLEARSREGEAVVVHAVRLFDLVGSLDEELRSLRVFYADPRPHLDGGERFEVAGSSAQRIGGRTVHGGSFWVHPEHRNRGLATLVPRITRAIAYTRWSPAFIWGFVEQRLHMGGLTRAYGPYQSQDVVVSRIAWRHGTTFYLVWMTSDDMLADIAGLVTQHAADRERRIEMPKTKRSPAPRRQGITKRS